jgi:crotonobetainyl-CoA:carnitine CoA-transferase CaiB-like acyl-CoA transferase
LVDLLGRPEWACDPRLARTEGRRSAEIEIEQRLSDWLAAQDCDEVADRLSAAGIPAAALINGYLISPHPQLEARGFRHAVTHPVSGEKHYAGLPFIFSDEGALAEVRAAPTLGQHNEAVLTELGLGEREIAALAEREVIGWRPPFED